MIKSSISSSITSTNNELKLESCRVFKIWEGASSSKETKIDWRDCDKGATAVDLGSIAPDII